MVPPFSVVEVVMRFRVWLLGMMMCLPLFAAAPASAQHVAGPAAIEQALSEARGVDESNRAAVLKALEREDVRQMAERFGVDLKDARSAVSGLSGSELEELAEPARALVEDQAGGATTVVISLTTLLLVLIIVILLAS
jgi:hypothetical protein